MIIVESFCNRFFYYLAGKNVLLEEKLVLTNWNSFWTFQQG